MTVPKTKKTIKKSLPKPELEKVKKIKIRVVGIGGGGGSIVSELASGMKKVSFVVANTDFQALKTISKKALHFQFGETITKGLGTGMNPDLGREAALGEKERIKKLLQGYDFCILVSSLGGGTGSGAAPVFAKISQDLGSITYGIFTLPFKFEGEKKIEIAKNALRKLKPKLNIFSVIPNERIFQIIDKKTPLKKALSTINKSLAESLEGLIEMIYEPGLINIDFADFKTVLTNLNPSLKRQSGGLAFLNTVKAERKEGIIKELIERLLNCPLYPYGISGAKGILLNIAGEKDLSLAEVSQISKTISSLSNKEAKIIFGISQSKKYKGLISTTLLATGLSTKVFPSRPRKKPVKTQIKKKELPEIKKEDEKKVLKKKVKKTKKVKKPKTPKKIKIKVKKPEKKIKKKLSTVGLSEVKVRKNALQIKKEMEAEEEEMLARERFWETPAFLRRKNN